MSRAVCSAASGPMADDQSSKRPRIDPGPSGESGCDESEIHALRSENARLRQQLLCADAENARLIRQQLQGSHETPPVVALTTVDLSRLDPSLVTQIMSFLGTSLELRNLALTCGSFGWRQTASGLDWSLVEEVARQVVCSGRNDIDGARITRSPYVRGTTTWLSILRESEEPLKFDTLLGHGIEHDDEDRTSVRTGVDICAAVASNYVMKSGIHYAEFHIAAGRPKIGIVRPMPNLAPVRYAYDAFSFFKHSLFDDFLAARTDEWGTDNVHACIYNAYASWTNWDDEVQIFGSWRGMEGCEAGDTVGMLLNLDEGALTVYKNNRRLGVMKDGLSGSYCWYAVCTGEATITIKKNEAPRA